MIKRCIFLLTLVVVFGIIGSTNAQTSLDYYKELFNSWGISVDVLPRESTKLDTPATKKDLQTLLQVLENGETEQKLTGESIINTNKEGRYLLLLASQFQTTPQVNDGILGYQSIILVCDSLETALLSQGVSCGSNSLDFADQNPNESSVSNRILQTIQPVKVNDVNYYLLPQVLLITPQYQKNLSDYFRALSRAQASANTSDDQKPPDNMAHDLLKTLKDSSIFESTIYALIILLFVVALNEPIVMLIRNPKRFLEQDLYANQTRCILNFLTKNSGIISFIFLILAIFYIPIFYALTVKAQLLGDPAYPIKYLSTTLNPLNIPKYLTSQNLFRVGLLFFHYILALFGLLLILPNLAKVFTKATQKIAGVRLKTNFVKWLIPVTIVLNGLLLAFVDLKSLTGFLSLSAAILLISLFYLKSKRVEYSKLFPKKERLLVITTMFAVLALNVFCPLVQRSRPTNYAYEPLIGIKDGVVALPYSKKWGKNVLFDPYFYTGNSKVFADSYLIYAPNTQKIINKPLKDFAKGKSVTVISSNPNDTIEALLKKTELLPFVTTNTFSPLFALDNTSSNMFDRSNIKVQITFSCDLTLTPSVVKLEIMSLNKLDPVNTELAEILNFPGCNTETGSETFEVPFDNYLIPQEQVVLRLRGIDTRFLANVKLLAGTTELPVRFLNEDILNKHKYSLLYSSKEASPEITAYSTKVKKEFTVSVKPTEDGFNLSEPINELMKQGHLQNPFIIWTSAQNEMIGN